jgi:hypothetical protein
MMNSRHFVILNLLEPRAGMKKKTLKESEATRLDDIQFLKFTISRDDDDDEDDC